MPRRALKRERTSKRDPKRILDDNEPKASDADEDPPPQSVSETSRRSEDTRRRTDETNNDINEEPVISGSGRQSPGVLNKDTADEPAEPPRAKFQPMEKVIARDNDGVMYDAVIRRVLYGRGQAESIQLGFCSHAEAQLLQEQAEDEPPCWHYFIHYNQWNSKWDRWVREYDVYPCNESIKQYAARVMEAHKKLRQDMAKKVKGKKSFQTIDGAKFLQEWRKRLNTVDAEHNINNPRFDTASAIQQAKKRKVEKKSDDMSKAAMLEERKLRERGLTKKCKDAVANKINLPFGLKRVLVEQWEIITQCDMVTDLPASVTVRNTLDAYLRSKGVDPALCNAPPEKSSGKKTSTLVTAKVKNEQPQDQVQAVSEENAPERGTEQVESVVSAQTDAMTVDKSHDAAKDTPAGTDSMEVDAPKQTASDSSDTPTDPMDMYHSTDAAVTLEASAHKQNDQEVASAEISDEVQGWIDMANGIAQFFDEALHRLLFREEYPQLRVIQRTEELNDRAYSEIYGCEYLLRLFTRLPELLVHDLTPEECRPIFAKVNDLARFLHKNQSSYLVASHRKPNGDEQTEAIRMAARLQKKRLREDNASRQSSAKKTRKDAVVAPKQTVDEKPASEGAAEKTPAR